MPCYGYRIVLDLRPNARAYLQSPPQLPMSVLSLLSVPCHQPVAPTDPAYTPVKNGLRRPRQLELQRIRSGSAPLLPLTGVVKQVSNVR